MTPPIVARVAAAALLFAAAAGAGTAAAAPSADRVLGEALRPIDVAVAGGVTAWTHHPRRAGRAVELVVHDGRRIARRIDLGRSPTATDRASSPISLGRDARRRLVVAFLKCRTPSSCEIRVARASGGPSRRLVRLAGEPSDLVVAGGRVLWTDPDRESGDRDDIRSRSLSGGPVSVVARNPGGRLVDLDARRDRVAAVVSATIPGSGSNDDGSETSSIAQARSDSPRMRTLTRGGADVAFVNVILTSRGATALLYEEDDDEDSLVPSAFVDVVGGRRRTRDGGMWMSAWDAEERAAAIVQAPSGTGCQVLLRPDTLQGEITEGERERIETRGTIDAPCRIVRAADHRGERLLPLEISISGRTAVLTRAVLSGGRVVRRVPQRRAGVVVRVQDPDARTVATLRTDADGAVPLPPASVGRPNAVIVAAAPGIPSTYAVDRGR